MYILHKFDPKLYNDIYNKHNPLVQQYLNFTVSGGYTKKRKNKKYTEQRQQRSSDVNYTKKCKKI